MEFIFFWCLTGIACSFYWPIRYREHLDVGDWIDILRWLPINMCFGPFSLLTTFPI